MRAAPLMLAVTLALAGTAAAQNVVDGPYDIMRPEPGSRDARRAAPYEPWLAPKYKSPRGTVKRPSEVRPRLDPEQQRAVIPPPIVVPQTGRVLPNLPTTAPAVGPLGRESYQDRAVRCSHQAGVYGGAAGDRGAYIGGCINQ